MVTKEYLNFYENMKEATMRLQYSVVLYEGEPYYVLCLANHKEDGIFRVYLDPIGHPEGSINNRTSGIPVEHPDSFQRGELLDQWMDKNPKSGIIRRVMNSPGFARFRPFPLGMCNYHGNVYYVERQPQRHTQQGLTQQMLYQTLVRLDLQKTRTNTIDVTGLEFRECVLGQFPSFTECVKNLLDDKVSNKGVAFHRDFALVRGPINTLFLAYKSDVVGFLPFNDAKVVRLSAAYLHTKEAVIGTGLFSDIIV